MKAHSNPGLTLVHRMAIIPFQQKFGLVKLLGFESKAKKEPDRIPSG
jgi:hypothetical protein